MELPGAKRLGDDRRPLGTLRCWRHSDIGPARGIVVTPALKEWSAAVHALLDGRQTVLLRKGGIGEKRGAPARRRRAGLIGNGGNGGKGGLGVPPGVGGTGGAGGLLLGLDGLT